MSGGNGFVWGAATAAFQIEGATTVDGRGESIWDRFAASPGRVHNGDTGDPACEHYFRWREDLDLMQSLGLQGYRFSISWPRIQPDGRGPVNRKGIDFYRRLVEGLRERDIAPLATLYHWDLPQALEDEGGWASRDVVERYVEYADIVFAELSGVGDWLTLNEPWVVAFLGYAYGTKAPGATDWPRALRASHHLLLSHGAALRRFREAGYEGRIGVTIDLTVAHPATPSEEDTAAACRLDGHQNRWFLDPLLRGTYPQDIVELYESQFGPFDAVKDGDLDLISQPLDFLGVNFYRPHVVADGTGDDPVLRLDYRQLDAERTAMGWPVVPSALTELLVRVQRDYGDVPVLITENGAAFDDELDGGVVVEDDRRLAYVKGHVEAVERAREAGVDVRGYYVWSLLDNFEWEHGYDKRFGIVFVDFATQRRILKRSALWYRDLIAARTSTRS